MKKILYPLVLALSVVIGIAIGNRMRQMQNSNQMWGGRNYFSTSSNDEAGKFGTLFNLINEQYVDSVDVDSIAEAAIPSILSKLDPHTVYLSNTDMQMANDDLEGSFSGIGVQFSIEDDTVMISNVISGGPCEKKGVRAGDRIVKVDDKEFTGKEINTNKVVKTLRGKKGTHVKLGISRKGSKDLIDFDIVRDDISVSSIDISYMITPEVGFVRVNKFGEHTYREFMQSLLSLKESGAKRFIIDLRENSGGYLNAAINMVNEFLMKDQLIVYTQGRAATDREDFFANGKGHFQNYPVTVLINEWSASASEIFAGAMQDNDRGSIVGRRSFGKGLVQQSFPLDQNSEVRLTIARYYTPSGRCIQKPYKNEKDYTDEIMDRYNNGEMDDSSKYKHDEKEEKFSTVGGRVVYGGGGITPDVFVGVNKQGVNSYYRALNDRALYDFAFFYTDKNREQLSKYKTKEELIKYLNTQGLEYKLAENAKTKSGIKVNPTMLSESKLLIQNRLNACIVRNFFGDEGFFSVLNEIDPIVKKALSLNLEK
ncbi:MAG: S41 family peptidase [Paludibacteraceae bacterium]|nr:S41 family peptidase [Paludibacteraceae bacterium]